MMLKSIWQPKKCALTNKQTVGISTKHLYIHVYLIDCVYAHRVSSLTFCKYQTTDSSDPSAWIGRGTLHAQARTYTHTHTQMHKLLPTPTLQSLIFPSSILHSTSLFCWLHKPDSERRRGGGDTDAAVALLFNTLTTHYRAQNDKEDMDHTWGGVEGRWGGWVGVDVGFMGLKEWQEELQHRYIW